MKKILAFALVLVMAMSLFTGCATTSESTAATTAAKAETATAAKAETAAATETAAAAEQKPFVYRIAYEPASTNYFSQADGPLNLLWGMCGGVLIYDNDATGEIEPAIFDKWESNDDATVWTFHIKEGVTWQDGEPFTADDVVFSWKWFTEDVDQFDFEVYWWYYGFKSVDKVDDNTFTVTTEEPFGGMLDAFTNQFCEVIPKHIWEGTNKAEFQTCDAAKNPVGAGPYIMEEYVVGQYIKLRANENYHLGAPEIKNITILIMPDSTSATVALEAGEIDLLGVSTADYARLKDKEGLKGELLQSNSQKFFAINSTKEPLSSKNVRQALNYLFDNDQVCQAFYDGCAYPLYGTFPYGVKYQNPKVWANVYSYDAAKAKALIEADGFALGNDGYYYKDGKCLEIELSYDSGSTWATNFALLYTETAKAGGVKVNLNGMESSLLSEKARAGEYELYATGYNLMKDPSSYECNYPFEHSLTPNILDDLWKKGTTLADGPERQAVYEEIDRIMNDECPWVFGVQNLSGYISNAKLDLSEAYLSSGYDIIHWEKLRWAE